MHLLTSGTELKRFRSSPLLRITLVVLIFVPLVYGALYLWAFWNPTEHLNKLPVALVNEDQPAMSSTGLVRAGASLQSELLARRDLGWHTVSAAQARRGVDDGKYYFMVVIPRDFSARIADAAARDGQPAQIKVTYNDTNSFLATTLGNEVMLQIRSTVSDATAKQLAAVLLTDTQKLASGVRDAASAGRQLDRGATRLSSSTATLHGGLDELASGASALSSGSASLSSGASTLADGLAPATARSAALASGARSVADGSTSLAAGAASASAGATKISAGSQTLSAGLNTLAGGVDSASAGASSLSSGLAQLKTGAGSLESGLAALQGQTAGLPSETSSLQTAAGEIEQLTGALQSAPSSTTLAAVQSQLAELDQLAQGVGSGAGSLSSGATALNSAVSSLYAGSQSLSSGIDSAATGAGSLSSGLSGLHTGAVTAQAGARSLSTATGSLSSGLNTLRDGASSLRSGSSEVASGASSLASGVASASDAASQIAAGSDQVTSGASKLASSTRTAASGAGQLQSGTVQLSDRLTEFARQTTAGAKQAPSFTKAEIEHVASVISAPVALHTHTLNNQSSWGEGFAPFFISLATFVGALITWLILRPVPTRPLGSGVSGLRHALTGYAPAALIGLGQAVVMMAVLHFGLGLTPRHWLATSAFVALVTCTFLAFQQMLIVLLGNGPGRLVALILLMLQLSSCGGTYPVQTSPSFFTTIHPFMPVTYSVNALRSLIAGGIQPRFWLALAIFVAILLVSLAISALSSDRQKVWTIQRLHPELEL